MGVIDIKNINARIIDYYETGGGKTFYAGYNQMAKYYSIKEGGVTDWTGYPGSGKTELLIEILINQSKWHGHKHLLNMPDAGSNEELIGKLIHKWTGKPFEEFYYNGKGEKVKIQNRITEQEIYRVLPEIMEYFKIYELKGKTRSKVSTPKEFWDFAAKSKEDLGIFSAVIDSWNYMRHDTKGYEREDKWLEDTLSYRNEIAESNNLHLHTIIHPRGAKKDKSGKIIMPDMHHLKGGSEWANNGKTIIIVHREFGSKITDVKIDKAKPKIVGVQGIFSLKLDLNIGGFYEQINEKRHYAHKEPVSFEKLPTKKHETSQLVVNDVGEDFIDRQDDDEPGLF